MTTSDETAMPKPENAETAAGKPAEGADPQAGASASDGGPAADADRLIALEAENAELRDRMLRAVAEMENLRRRTERELKEAKTYAIAGFARDMLVATDNLSRALMVVPAEAREGAEGTLKSLIEGIDMTEREMQRLLTKHGVVAVAAQGEKFDPHKHQAMFEVPDESVPEGTVVQVVQEGYTIGDRVLRPAMVGVSKGGGRRVPEAPRTGDPNEGAPGGQSVPPAGEGIDKSA